MAGVRRFEDIVAWQKARVLTGQVYSVTRQEPFRRDFGLSTQLQRASVSIMANIAEGFEHRSRKEFARFLALAGASCGEVRSHLYVALDAGYIDQPAFEQLVSLADETSRLISSFLTSLRTTST
jgi:four helix bundle protein